MPYRSRNRCAFLFTLLLWALAAPGARAENPKLVVFITIDQLRGDMPWRFLHRFGDGGFKYLIDKGTSYTNAHYRHSTTFTAVGHASLATGGNALQHGLAGNDWHDTANGKQVYCVEDDRHKIIGKDAKPHEGTSPRNLTASTFGDEVVLSSGGKARVFSVSIKDRGAILPGGHLGKAYWYSSSSGKFVTSTYYQSDYPAWVTAWNKAGHANAYKDKQWSLLHDRSTYIYGDRDDEVWEKSYKKLGRTFPHPLGNEDEKAFYAGLRFVPMGDELTLAFVKELVTQEKLGEGRETDVLAISFSATDYIGHAFGPDSLEAEDNLLRLDRTLAELFKFLDEKLGLAHVLIALSSDHGIDSVPERTQHLGLDAGRHRPDKFIETVNEGLKKRLNVQEALVKVFWNPSLYLDLDALSRLGIEVEVAENALREEILRVPGVRFAATRSDLLKGNVTSEPMHAKLQRAFHPTRSGNVLFVQDVGWYLYPKPDEFAAMHGSPYGYDTYVPVIFAGHEVKRKLIDREVAPEDMASTVTAYLGLKPPSGSTGSPLFEVLEGLRD